MNISGLKGISFPLPGILGGEKPAGADKLDTSITDEFLKEARKTPAERIRDAVLKEMGLSEEELDAMSPEHRSAVQREIAERLKQKLEASGEEQTGLLLDVNA